MIRRVICVAAATAVILLALVGFGQVSPFPSSVGTASDGSVATYQVQTVGLEKLKVWPKTECNWAGCTFKYNKEQTQFIAGGALAVIGWAGGPGGGFVTSTLQYPAQLAVESGTCLMQTYRWIGLVWQVRTYSC